MLPPHSFRSMGGEETEKAEALGAQHSRKTPTPSPGLAPILPLNLF